MQIQYALAGLGLLKAAIATPVHVQRGYYDISDDSECGDTPRRPQPYEPVDWNESSNEWPWDSECQECVVSCAREKSGLENFVLGQTKLSIEQYHHINFCGVMCVGTDDEKGACYGGLGDLRSQAAVIGFWLKEGGLVEGIGASSPGGSPGG